MPRWWFWRYVAKLKIVKIRGTRYGIGFGDPFPKPITYYRWHVYTRLIHIHVYTHAILGSVYTYTYTWTCTGLIHIHMDVYEPNTRVCVW